MCGFPPLGVFADDLLLGLSIAGAGNSRYSIWQTGSDDSLHIAVHFRDVMNDPLDLLVPFDHVVSMARLRRSRLSFMVKRTRRLPRHVA